MIALRRPSLYEQLCALPDHLVGEIVNGALIASPRPRFRHGKVSGRLGTMLGGPFDFGVGGPGGWWFLPEPELHFDSDVLVPDLAGWRRARMPEIPDVAFTSLAPDWICEVLSESTEVIDRGAKMPIYSRAGVRHAWLIDTNERALEVFRLESGALRQVASHRGSDPIRAEPFEAIELPLGALWLHEQP